MRLVKNLNLTTYPLILTAFLLICAALPARATDISTHSFAGCAFPDTGQASCYGPLVGPAAAACPYSGLEGQDADYVVGAAQHRYTVYNPVGISSVTVDNLTGLMWITNPKTDAGFSGLNDWASALSSCTVTMNAFNSGAGYAGYTDWRLPNVRELTSMRNFTASSPNAQVNSTAFPGTPTSSSPYWTSTTYVPNTTYAWYVNFMDAESTGMAGSPKTAIFYVRCVRGP